jgi:type II secretion system protein N
VAYSLTDLRDRLPRPSIQSLLKWLGYPLFFLFCFVLFSYWTFPWDRARNKLVEEAGKRGYALEIVDMSPSGLSGVTLSGVRLVLPLQPGETGPAQELLVEELSVRAGLFAFMRGSKAFSFDAELAGGAFEGALDLGKEEELDFEAEFENLNLTQLAALRKYTFVPMRGIATGDVEIHMPSEVDESSGHFDVTISDFTVGDGNAKVDIPGWGGLTLDEASAGDFNFKAEIQEGTMDIQRAEAHGSDLQLDAVGSVRLARPVKRSQLDVMFRIKIEDAYKEKSPKVATALGMVEQQRQFKAAQTSDGALQYALKGSLSGPLRPTPAGQESLGPPK